MGLVFPLALPQFGDILPILDGDFTLKRFEQMSYTASGDILTSELSPPKWQADITLAPFVQIGEANRISSVVEAIGSANAFHMFNPRAKYPAYDPDGTIVGGNALSIYSISSDLKSLRITGLPQNYKLSYGDMISIVAGGNVALFRIVDEVTANNVGLTPLFNITPSAKSWMAVGNSVNIKKPVARMHMMSYSSGTVSGPNVSGISFQAIETK